MLYDRPYMRAEPAGRLIPYLYWIAGTIGVCFLLQSVLDVWMGQEKFIYDWFSLSVDNLKSFKIWTLFTYAFLHANFWHVFVNLLGIIIAGRYLAMDLGHRALLKLFIGMTIVGGLCYALTHLRYGYASVVGASASAVGLIALFCLTRMEQRITFLLFFVLPVTLKPKWILWAILAINGFFFLFTELPMAFGRLGAEGDASVAWSAHLGGILVGWLYYLFALNPERVAWVPRPRVSIEPPRWARKKPAESTTKRPFKLNLNNPSAALRKEVDRILDKINSDGFASLTPEERITLEKAKDLLSK